MAKHAPEFVCTEPYQDQKPGTSGLRKPTRRFVDNKYYTENFIQAIFSAVGADDVAGSTIVVGGDGRYFLAEAIEKIVQIAAGNRVRKVIIGQDGILSTPALSAIVRKQQALGGILLTASHNPGGIDADFGIKYNCANGGPAPEGITNKIYAISKEIGEFKSVRSLNDLDLSKIGISEEYDIDGRAFTVEVVDSTDEYFDLMKQLFDFDMIKKFLNDTQKEILLDSMNGVTGPYCSRLAKELGLPAESSQNNKPLPDFGGLHPDPNLKWAQHLIMSLRNGDQDLGCAFDGDGDRNMILGANAFFVTPCDSLAVIAANCQDCIPYFKKNGLVGVARSMPTSGAVDRVAKEMEIPCFVTPTGWKFFGNLMDAGKMSLCGEESFGTSSSHIREKDGVWAALCWLSILAHKNQTVEEILTAHWKKYGRNYFTRYDYEQVESEGANTMMSKLREMASSQELIGKEYTECGKTFKVVHHDDFEYTDPIDGSVSAKQGIRINFEDGSRLVFRLSGTGSSGATVRLYCDSYEAENVNGNPQEVLKAIVKIALNISQLSQLTGREEPTVIT